MERSLSAVSPSVAAVALGVSVRSVRRLAAAGLLANAGTAREPRYLMSELETVRTRRAIQKAMKRQQVALTA